MDIIYVEERSQDNLAVNCFYWWCTVFESQKEIVIQELMIYYWFPRKMWKYIFTFRWGDLVKGNMQSFLLNLQNIPLSKLAFQL